MFTGNIFKIISKRRSQAGQSRVRTILVLCLRLLAVRMSRLNATIKLLFACGELLFLFASLFCVLASGIVASGKIPAFAFPLAKQFSTIVVLISFAALVCSCFGCCAVLRQTKRRGCFSGRRMLVSR